MFPRVLVIDGDPDIRKLMRLALSDYTLDVYLAKNPGEGLSLAASHAPDLAFLDLDLSPGAERRTCALLKKSSGSGEISIVLMSGILPGLSPGALEQLGASRFMPKPFTVMELKACVRNLARDKPPEFPPD